MERLIVPVGTNAHLEEIAHQDGSAAESLRNPMDRMPPPQVSKYALTSSKTELSQLLLEPNSLDTTISAQKLLTLTQPTLVVALSATPLLVPALSLSLQPPLLLWLLISSPECDDLISRLSKKT